MPDTTDPEFGSPDWELATSLQTIRDTKDRTLGFEVRDAVARRYERLHRQAFHGSRFTATPAEVDAHLRTVLAEDTYLRYQQAIGNAAVTEAVAEIREETERLKAHQVLEPDKFRPCRDAADQIDPAQGGGPWPGKIVQIGEQR
ncbi:hypothetical protein QMK19_03440 [Streptomyces sp. H10-C2]|uniref:hypothetical protein n=1 Tax=unclassified Streptomyces TaxID=2593676 RepID=UPI0024BB6809|nr:MULTISPECIES: hypothetical protein [unclassified Streptomyces]MDJ0342240.1 hypothetical protein [Streptomyces sp. PH10-H1]MDJ0368754.1 hypothetical protein [Streptomyces sp. H10-C2]